MEPTEHEAPEAQEVLETQEAHTACARTLRRNQNGGAGPLGEEQT